MRRAVALLCGLAACGCAARAPAPGLRILPDQVYAERDGMPLRADVYAPLAPGPHAGVLVLHGGSWQRGSRADMRSVARRLAARGYVAVAADYRLAPAHRFPAQLEDCRTALRWMRREAARLGLDPSRVAAFGYSAGGHLAALLATDGAGDPAARVQAAVAGGAPTDLARFGDARVMRRLLGDAPAELPARARAASPLRHASADDPPLFLYHGRSDWLVDAAHARALRDALRAAGVPVGYYETPYGHFATFAWDEEPVAAATDFLDVWLAPTTLAAVPQAVRPAR
jgi:acetyl esterase/lipase